MHNIQAVPHQQTQHVGVAVDKMPDACPRCHHAINAIGPVAAAIAETEYTKAHAKMEVVFRCPRSGCARLFIGRYRKDATPGTNYYFQSVTPLEPQEPALPPEVISVSPAFKEIYTQAAAAEIHGLDQIAGVGYRKALEFLVKDYCIRLQPNVADEIRKEFLGNTVSIRVKDPYVKQAATRATWLGNDETHYERRWEGRDVEDLKTLIKLTSNWIASSVLTAQYVSDMPDGKRQG